MNIKYKNIPRIAFILICLIILIFPSCAQRPPKVLIEKEKKPAEAIKPEKEKPEQEKISEQEKLTAQAEKFFSRLNYQDALLVYNQVLSQTDETEKPKIISAIENVLSKTPAEDIAQFIEIKNITIPKALLLYWLGRNYGLENNLLQSKKTLEAFLFQYPDHPYYSDAENRIETINQSFFKPDTIGCLLPLTGKYAIFGQRALSGIQLAIQQVSKKYSRKFKVIIKDTKADPDLTVKGVRQLHEKHVAGIIGPLLNVKQAGRQAQKLQVPMIALTQKNSFPMQGDYLFANFITPQMQVQTLGAYLFLKLGIKKTAILYPDEKYGRTYMELFWDIVDEYDGQVVGVEPYDGSKTDFTEPIQKLTGQFFPVPDFLKPEFFIDKSPVFYHPVIPGKEEKEKIQVDFEALFIPDSPSRVRLILPQLAYNDVKDIYLIGTNLWHNKTLLKDAQGYNKNSVITDGFFANSKNSATTEFTDRFESLFNTKPRFLEAISYDTAFILLSTSVNETIDSRQTLKNALQGNRIFEGVTGSTIFDKNGIAHRQLFLMTIKDGEFVEITW